MHLFKDFLDLFNYLSVFAGVNNKIPVSDKCTQILIIQKKTYITNLVVRDAFLE